jgi:hypothetical protein
MFNFGNFSRSKTSSEQSASVYLTQQFSGTCNDVCQNTMNNVSIDLINTTVGGDVSITQTCSTNGACMIGSSMDSTMDVFFKAANSSSAQNAASGVVSGGNVEWSTTKSRQDMRLSSYQNTNESCNIGTYNEMNNVSIYAANSNIGGSVSISQEGETGGNCVLDNTMSSAASVTGLTDNVSTSGKQKGGILHFIIIVTVLLIALLIAKSIAGNSQANEQKQQDLQLAYARAQAGCPGGQKPIMDTKTGLPIIDMKTMRPVCPPYVPQPMSAQPPSSSPQIGNAPPQLSGPPSVLPSRGVIS